jgi:hypothetical protein
MIHKIESSNSARLVVVVVLAILVRLGVAMILGDWAK